MAQRTYKITGPEQLAGFMDWFGPHVTWLEHNGFTWVSVWTDRKWPLAGEKALEDRLRVRPEWWCSVSVVKKTPTEYGPLERQDIEAILVLHWLGRHREGRNSVTFDLGEAHGANAWSVEVESRVDATLSALDQFVVVKVPKGFVSLKSDSVKELVLQLMTHFGRQVSASEVAITFTRECDEEEMKEIWIHGKHAGTILQRLQSCSVVVHYEKCERGKHADLLNAGVRAINAVGKLDSSVLKNKVRVMCEQDVHEDRSSEVTNAFLETVEGLPLGDVEVRLSAYVSDLGQLFEIQRLWCRKPNKKEGYKHFPYMELAGDIVDAKNERQHIESLFGFEVNPAGVFLHVVIRQEIVHEVLVGKGLVEV